MLKLATVVLGFHLLNVSFYIRATEGPFTLNTQCLIVDYVPVLNSANQDSVILNCTFHTSSVQVYIQLNLSELESIQKLSYYGYLHLEVA